jgi:hypothetical protein
VTRVFGLILLATAAALISIAAAAQSTSPTNSAPARNAPRLAASNTQTNADLNLACAGKTINIAGSGDYLLLGEFPDFGPAAPNVKHVCAQSGRVRIEILPREFRHSSGSLSRRGP